MLQLAVGARQHFVPWGNLADDVHVIPWGWGRSCFVIHLRLCYNVAMLIPEPPRCLRCEELRSVGDDEIIDIDRCLFICHGIAVPA